MWHCSLSLRAEEGVKTDEQWGAITNAFVERMGFVDEAKAPTPWVAVRHGVSKNCTDHIHIVVNLVREDGLRATTWGDFRRAQELARELEREFGLNELDASRPCIGVKPGEREADAGGVPARCTSTTARTVRRTGRSSTTRPARRSLVRSCASTSHATTWPAECARATAAATEDEFVRRMRRTGLMVRPRFAAGREDVVTGYAVAARPVAGERAIWYGGGHLAHDLTLPKLRSTWPDTPEDAQLAAGEWSAARRGQRPVMAGPEMSEPDPALWEQYAAQLSAVREQLRAVPVGDDDTSEHVARQAAGTFAAWSLRVEPTPGPLAAAADSLARSAHSRRPATPRREHQDSATVAFTGAALLLAQVANGGKGRGAQLLMMRQLVALAGAIYDAHKANGELRRAADLAARTQGAVQERLAALPAPVGAPTTPAPSIGGPSQAPAVGSPVPPPMAPYRPPTRAGQRDPGIER